jgi:ABC transporter substrate binding protein
MADLQTPGSDRRAPAHHPRTGHGIRRRELLLLLGSAMAAARQLQAQQKAMPVIGWLSIGSFDPNNAVRVNAFWRGLNQTGYVEGENVAIEYRWAQSQYDRLPALAADLVRREMTVIVAADFPSALAAKAATSTTPIVFLLGIDPVQFGLVASLNLPGGNITGVALLSAELSAKRLDLLHELVPTVAVVAVWRLHRQNLQGDEAGRPAGPAGGKNRARHQSRDRQNAGIDDTAARRRRRGHRIRGQALACVLAQRLGRSYMPGNRHHRNSLALVRFRDALAATQSATAAAMARLPLRLGCCCCLAASGAGQSGQHHDIADAGFGVLLLGLIAAAIGGSLAVQQRLLVTRHTVDGRAVGSSGLNDTNLDVNPQKWTAQRERRRRRDRIGR